MMGMAATLKGQLLIASPSIHDPNFRRTVVYMTEHGEEGAMGLVLNRAAETTVGEAVPDLAWLADEDAVVHVGGPVAPQSVVVLAEFEEPEQSALIVDADLGFVPAEVEDTAALSEALGRRRGFARHAGWGPGQGAGGDDIPEALVLGKAPARGRAQAAAHPPAQPRPSRPVEVEDRAALGGVERQWRPRLGRVVHREVARRVERDRLLHRRGGVPPGGHPR